eukprot:4820137-Heterocapsa_arctica.AAC.1
MDQKAELWMKYWDPGSIRPAAPVHQPWMLRKAEAETNDIQKITIKQVKQIIAIAPAEAGMGADGWRVRQWQQLPEGAVQDLTQILIS